MYFSIRVFVFCVKDFRIGFWFLVLFLKNNNKLIKDLKKRKEKLKLLVCE